MHTLATHLLYLSLTILPKHTSATHLLYLSLTISPNHTLASLNSPARVPAEATKALRLLFVNYYIVIGKGHLNCPKLQVHRSEMKEAENEKYLGDVIDKSGNIQATFNKLFKRGEGIISEIQRQLSK